MSQLFAWGGQSTRVSALASVLPKNTQGWSPLEWTGWIYFRMDWLLSPCSPRDSQESSPTPQFKSINSSALSFLHSPTLTSIHDHWKNHSESQDISKLIYKGWSQPIFKDQLFPWPNHLKMAQLINMEINIILQLTYFFSKNVLRTVGKFLWHHKMYYGIIHKNVTFFL